MTPDQHAGYGVRRTAPSRTATSTWPGYAAAGLAFAFAAVSLYWVLGGTAGVGTLGGRIEALVRARDRTFIAVMWVVVILKIAGGLLAVALVRPWGRRLPQRWLLVTAWLGAAVLTVYGALQVTGVALITFGVVTTTEPQNQTVLLWRLLLWEPWFLVWGLLLGLATLLFGRSSPKDDVRTT